MGGELVSADVTVGIVTYRALPQVQKCIDHLLRSKRPFVLNLVDNSPPDDPTRAWVESLHDVLKDHPVIQKFKLHIPPDNIGFGRGYNRIFASSDTSYSLMLNPDCYIPPDGIDKLVDCMVRRNAGIVGCRTHDMKDDIRSDGMWFTEDGEPRTFVVTKWKDGKPEEYETLVVGASCCLVRKDVYQSLLFDEAYGLGYYEDTDYCLQAITAGFSVWWTPEVEVIHEQHASWMTRPEVELTALTARNLMYFIRKWKDRLPELKKTLGGRSPQHLITSLN